MYCNYRTALGFRFMGSYNAAHGGWTGDAFVALTGGLAERLEDGAESKQGFFKRIRNALDCGSIVACTVDVRSGFYTPQLKTKSCGLYNCNVIGGQP